jgi:hypothetical protein
MVRHGGAIITSPSSALPFEGDYEVYKLKWQSCKMQTTCNLESFHEEAMSTLLDFVWIGNKPSVK